MRAAAGVYLIALSTRLISDCRSTSRSPRPRGAPAHVDGDRLPLLLRQHAEVADDLLGQIAQIDDFDRQLRLPALGARQRQQAIDQPGQPIRPPRACCR